MRNVQLTPQLIQAVRDAADIVAVASDHCRLTRRGRKWTGLCPIHKEKTPSFHVDPAQGFFYCFGCGAGGDAIKLHMLTTGDDFPAAIEALALRFGIPLPAATQGRDREGADRGRERALEAAFELYRRNLARSPVAQAYLEKRKVGDDLVERFALGYAPDDWRSLLTALEGKIPLRDLEAAGLVARSEKADRPYDRFRHRLIFPIHTPSGRLVGFGGRTLGDDRAKYVNTAETEDFHKGRLLYGLHLAKRAAREEGRLLLVEGYFDVVSSVAAGVEAAVASMGTALTVEQARLAARYADEVTVGYDGDEAGETAFRRALPILLSEGLSVRRARFGAGHDPDSLRLEAGEAAVAGAVAAAPDGVLLEIGRLTGPEALVTPHAQARAASAVAELVKAIPDSIVRLGYARRAAERLGVPLELLLERLGPSRGAVAPARAPAPAKPAGPRLVRNLEEQVLEMLLSGGSQTPALEDLPHPDVFWDPPCRNIFGAFCRLYREEGRAPRGLELTPLLEGDDASVARLAQLVLESPNTSGAEGLPTLLDHLSHRWREKKIEGLAREIEDAGRRGDHERQARLIQEKLELSRRHHLRRRERPIGGVR
ncbi:MAG TPA: DNA primase [Thermoanaerobaculia bacterium]|nr:DNA primase [Thermoanaerobaculia bacterium]